MHFSIVGRDDQGKDVKDNHAQLDDSKQRVSLSFPRNYCKVVERNILQPAN
jgi:outer membrane usher protein FimD/PapC